MDRQGRRNRPIKFLDDGGDCDDRDDHIETRVYILSTRLSVDAAWRHFSSFKLIYKLLRISSETICFKTAWGNTLQ